MEPRLLDYCNQELIYMRGLASESAQAHSKCHSGRSPVRDQNSSCMVMDSAGDILVNGVNIISTAFTLFATKALLTKMDLS